MERFVLTATQWAKMEPYCLGNPTDPRRSGRNRLFVEAVLWIVRTVRRGAICRACSASGTRCFKRCRDWVKANVFQACSDEPDLEYLIVKAHRHGQGAQAGLNPASEMEIVQAVE